MMRLRDFLIYSTCALALQQLSSLAAADDDHGRIGKEAETLPLFDAHMHYKREAWKPFPPDVVLSLMDANGVAMALVSSTPDEGTIKLWKYAPGRFVPEMRPYTGRFGSSNWTQWNEVGDYIEQRISEYPHQGIGEFHLHRIDPQDEPLMKKIVSLALEKNIPLHVHSDHEPIEYLYSLGPELTIIWAHAGMMEPPDVVADLMARYPGLYADTSYRETDILNGAGGIDPEWRRVLEKHADRFMVGSDTWVNDQWEEYDRLIAMNRRWLAYLSPRTANKIAFQNAERLFGITIDAKKASTR